MWNTKEGDFANTEIWVTGIFLSFFTCVSLLRLKIGQGKQLVIQPAVLFGPIPPRTQFHETLDPQPRPGSGARPQGQCANMPRIISASKKGKYNAVLEELNNGVAIDTEDSEGATALYWSSCRGDVSLTRFLISKGANVNHKVKWEATPLHAAADRGHSECVECLLTCNADVNAQNCNHDTPLHLAAYRGYYQVCLLLLAYNASLNIQNFKGKTPYQEAKEAGHGRIVKILANNNKGGTFPLENKTMEDVFRSKFSSENGENHGDVGHSYQRCHSDENYSDRRSDISYSAPILLRDTACSNSGHHSFPNLNMLSSFPTSYKEQLPNTTLYNYTTTEVKTQRHPTVDNDLVVHLNQCSPLRNERPLYIQASERELYAKIEDLELRLAKTESSRMTLEKENIVLQQQNASLLKELESCRLKIEQNTEHCLEGARSTTGTIAELKEKLQDEQLLRLAAESRSRQAMKDMFILRGRLDEVLASSGQISGHSCSSDYSRCERLNQELS